MQDKAKITDQLYLHIKLYLENVFLYISDRELQTIT